MNYYQMILFLLKSKILFHLIFRDKDNEYTPCDILILDGKVIVNESLLTGEATPQMKDSILSLQDDVVLDMKVHKRNIIFGGTKVLLSESGDRFKPPNNGCVGIVLRTGFETSQGKLIRTILFASERVTANNSEALLFILILLIFAMISSSYVLYTGLQDQNRKLFKLILNCVMIITSVVPPELPFELSLAVNNSLLYLSQLGIFCTEPFRIPFAGKVDYCCFDKTGTLTTDKMILKGIHKDQTKYSKLVLSGCHSLIHIDGQTVGDPMEVAGLNGSDFTLNKDFSIVNNLSKKKYKIVKRFPFTSELKRMTTIIQPTDKGYIGLTKGAPEILKEMFEKVPDDYDETYQTLMNNGFRVIALGYKNITNDRVSREEIEKDLQFSGFATFQSDIKQDTFSTIQNLLLSNHKCIMITGDNVLTGAHVGKELNFIDKPIIILTKNNDSCEWISSLDNQKFSMDSVEIKNNYSLCVSGDALSIVLLKDPHWLERWVRDVKIFARVDPDQKELILVTLKKLGHSTLMCGDGTNDTGALKQADIGVALLDGITDQEWEKLSKKPKPLDMKKKSISEMMQEESNVVRLGDASIASPFTSKKSSILSTSHILRQGRCTLVTTIQMYKILAINSLISAYSLSVLYMEGVKFGDYQMMISGMFVAVLFLFISRSKPLEILSNERPDTSIFSPFVILSILFQSILNIIVLIYSSQEIKLLMTKPIDPDSEFAPSAFNTVVFLVTTIQTLLTFINNYKGHPFLQSITENKGLLAILVAHSLLLTILVTEISPSFNEYFQLALLGDFKYFLIKLLLFNIFASLIFEFILKQIRKLLGK